METKTKGSRAGTKNKTWCGVPIDLYRRRKSELSKEAFAAWWLKKTGRPLCLREEKKIDGMVSWSTNSKLYRDLEAARVEISILKQRLSEERNRSWISRLFNLKG